MTGSSPERTIIARDVDLAGYTRSLPPVPLRPPLISRLLLEPCNICPSGCWTHIVFYSTISIPTLLRPSPSLPPTSAIALYISPWNRIPQFLAGTPSQSTCQLLRVARTVSQHLCLKTQNMRVSIASSWHLYELLRSHGPKFSHSTFIPNVPIR